MPQITLNKKQIDELSTFAKKHDLKKWFMAKDESAYVGASAGEAGNKIFYFKGMDPRIDEYAYDIAREKFGGDDFGQHFDIADIHRLSADPLTSKLIVKVTDASITIDVYTKKPQPKKENEMTTPKKTAPKKTAPKKKAAPKAAAKAPTKKAAVAPSKKRNATISPKKGSIGDIIVKALIAGKDAEAAIAAVLKKHPEATTKKASVAWYKNKVKHGLVA